MGTEKKSLRSMRDVLAEHTGSKSVTTIFILNGFQIKCLIREILQDGVVIENPTSGKTSVIAYNAISTVDLPS